MAAVPSAATGKGRRHAPRALPGGATCGGGRRGCGVRVWRGCGVRVWKWNIEDRIFTMHRTMVK
jgi:hypothetical protein